MLFTGRRIVETVSEFSKLSLGEDDVLKSIYENKGISNYSTITNVIRSDGGNVKDNSVANPNINIPRPQVTNIFEVKLGLSYAEVLYKFNLYTALLLFLLVM